jgi:phage-related protein (TIGR01555 family)
MAIYEHIMALADTMRVLRRDGWENWLTGVGTRGRDKSMHMGFVEMPRLTVAELSTLYHFSDLAATIVDFRPSEMFREGFILEDTDSDWREQMRKDITEREVLGLLLEGMLWGRLYGGDILIIGADDGRDPSEPLDEKNIKSIDFLTNVDMRYVVPASYYLDPHQPKYLQPEKYRVMDITGIVYLELHETRVIRFGGARTDQLRRRANNSWDYSVLQRPHEVLRSFEQTWKSVDNLISDASQGVFKIKGLVNAIATPNGRELMRARMELADMSRSVARSVMLDAQEGEDFSRTATQFTGLPELMDRQMMRLSAATRIPVAILMGRSAAGLNATGDSDFKAFYDSVAAEQEVWLAPLLRRLLRILMLNKSGPTGGVEKDDYVIKFPPLWQPTAKEIAEIGKLNAERDAVRITSQVWLPHEVALARKNGDDAPVKIDEELRNRMMVNEKQAATEASQQPDSAPSGSASSGVRAPANAGDTTSGANENTAQSQGAGE